MNQEEEFDNIWNSKSQQEQIRLTKIYLSKYPGIDTLIGKDSRKNSLLHLACSVDNLELVKFLLDMGANVNINYKGRNPLHSALSNGNRNNNEFEIIKLLTRKGVNIRERLQEGYRQSCFLLVLQCGDLEMVKYLDEYFPESCSMSPEFADRGLHAASANHRDGSILAYCLKVNRDVNKVDENGETPILNTLGEKMLTEQLIKLGADINFQNIFGSTVLHRSVDNEIDKAINYNRELDVSNTEYLLLCGANKKITNKDGCTALDIATKVYGGDYLIKVYRELFERY